eukprot:5512400-Prymnesium_polylepis.1
MDTPPSPSCIAFDGGTRQGVHGVKMAERATREGLGRRVMQEAVDGQHPTHAVTHARQPLTHAPKAQGWHAPW